MNKTKPDLVEEKKLWKNGYKYIIGIDEVGRGAFAGPVVVGAVIFDKRDPCTKIILSEINDSKLLNPKNREKLDKEIRTCAQFYSIAQVGVSIINKAGIGKTTKIAFTKSITTTFQQIVKENYSLKNCHAELASASPEILKPIRQAQGPEYTEGLVQDDKKRKVFVLVDGFHIKYIRGIGLKNQKAIIKGDRKSISIAAASIIAKVYRDKLMKDLAKKYREYHFEDNKGYGTKEHQIAIKKYGLSRIHRKSFNLKKFQ